VKSIRSPAVVSALTVLIVGTVVFLSVELEPLSRHMTLHIALMNVLAPIAAAGLYLRISARSSSRLFWCATLAQISCLWIWHAPALQRLVIQSESVQLLMHGTLFVTALVFWILLSGMLHKPWQAIAALLLTGKLACLLAALFIFSPTVLHAGDPHHLVHLSDQQLAGLLMITACPLSYVLAAIVLAADALLNFRPGRDAPRAAS
jgi:putative membrane protein